MFKIFDGREEFFQWDLDRKLIVSDGSIEQVHFCNRTDDCSLIRNVYEVNKVYLVDVPNVLLQQDWRINVYAYDENYTRHSDSFRVVPRSKPESYVYTDEEVAYYTTLEKKLNRLEEAGIGGAVQDYLEKNPVKSAVTSVNGKTGAVALTANDVGALPKTTYIPSTAGLASKEYVDEAIANIEVEANVDLRGYYTKTETDQQISEAITTIDLSDYLTIEGADSKFLPAGPISESDPNFLPIFEAIGQRALKSDIPSLEGYATDEDVSAAIAAAQLEGAEVDLSAYYTKSETDAAIEAAQLEVPDLSGYYTKEETEQKIEEAIADADIEIPELSKYALKTEIPTATDLALQGLATKTYVNSSVSNSVKGLATEEYVSAKIAEAELNDKEVDLSAYALKSDFEGYATEEYVDQAIENLDIDIDIPEVDLSNYYTKQETGEMIAQIETQGLTEVYVGTEEPTGADATTARIWINPEGGQSVGFVTKAYLEEYVDYVLNSIGNAEGGSY